MWRLVLAALCGVLSVSLAAEGTYECATNGIFPVRGSCDSYYVCIDGAPFVEFCPFSLIFDPTSLVCNYPDVLNITTCSAQEFFNFDCSATTAKSFVTPERRNPTLPAPPAPRESDVDRYYSSYPYYYSYYYYYPYYTYWYYYWRSNPEARNAEDSPLKKSPEMPKATNSFEEEANRIYYSYYYPYYYYYYYPYYYSYYWRNAEVDKRSPDAAFPLSLPEPARSSVKESETRSEEGADRYYYYPYYYSYWYYPYYYSYWRNANPEERSDNDYISQSFDQDEVCKRKTDAENRYYYGYYYPYYYSYWYYPGYYWRDSAAEKAQPAHKTRTGAPFHRDASYPWNNGLNYPDYYFSDGGYYDYTIDIYLREVAEKIGSQGPTPLPIPSADRKAPTQDESNPTSRYDGYYYPYYYSYYYYYPYYSYWRNSGEGKTQNMHMPLAKGKGDHHNHDHHDHDHHHHGHKGPHGDRLASPNPESKPSPIPSAVRKAPTQESNPTSRYDGYYYPYYYSYYYYYPYYSYWRNSGEERSLNMHMPLAKGKYDGNHDHDHHDHDHDHHDHHDHDHDHHGHMGPGDRLASPNPENKPSPIPSADRKAPTQESNPTSRYNGDYYLYDYSYYFYPDYSWRNSGEERNRNMNIPLVRRQYDGYYDHGHHGHHDHHDHHGHHGHDHWRASPNSENNPEDASRNYYYPNYNYGYYPYYTYGSYPYSTYGSYPYSTYSNYYYRPGYWRDDAPTQEAKEGRMNPFRSARRFTPSEYIGDLGVVWGGGERMNSFRNYDWDVWRSNGVEVPKRIILDRNSAWYVNYNWNNTQSLTSQTGSYTSFCSSSQCKNERNVGTACSSSYFVCMANGQPRLLTCPVDFVFNSVTGMCGPRDEVPECMKA